MEPQTNGTYNSTLKGSGAPGPFLFAISEKGGIDIDFLRKVCYNVGSLSFRVFNKTTKTINNQIIPDFNEIWAIYNCCPRNWGRRPPDYSKKGGVEMIFFSILFMLIFFSVVNMCFSYIFTEIYGEEDEEAVKRRKEWVKKQTEEKTAFKIPVVNLFAWMGIGIVCIAKSLWTGRGKKGATLALKISVALSVVFFLIDIQVITALYGLAIPILLLLVYGYYLMFCLSSGYSLHKRDLMIGKFKIMPYFGDNYAVGEAKTIKFYLLVSWIVAIVVVLRIAVIAYAITLPRGVFEPLGIVTMFVLAIAGTMGPIMGYFGTQRALKALDE